MGDCIWRFCMSKRTTHGESYSRAYNIWAMMRQRCNNPNAANYRLYGGRGITCCARWASFAAFLQDMGHPPNAKATLDRINSDGHYTPDNCRWADPETQACNRRNGVKITAFGQTLSLSQWTRKTALTRDQIKHRIFVMGMAPEQALTSERMSWVRRRVLRTNLDGSSAQRYGSLAEAAKATGVVKGSLWAALKKSTPAEFSGYLWAYEE